MTKRTSNIVSRIGLVVIKCTKNDLPFHLATRINIRLTDFATSERSNGSRAAVRSIT